MTNKSSDKNGFKLTIDMNSNDNQWNKNSNAIKINFPIFMQVEESCVVSVENLTIYETILHVQWKSVLWSLSLPQWSVIRQHNIDIQSTFLVDKVRIREI